MAFETLRVVSRRRMENDSETNYFMHANRNLANLNEKEFKYAHKLNAASGDSKSSPMLFVPKKKSKPHLRIDEILPKQSANHHKSKKEPLQKNKKIEPYDLYNPAPTIFYLKEKYKMYWDWLEETSTGENIASKTNTNVNAPNLSYNWYHYESSIYKNQNSLKYLNKLNKKNESQVVAPIENVETLKTAKKYHSSLAFHDSKLNENLSKHRLSVELEPGKNVKNNLNKPHDLDFKKTTSDLSKRASLSNQDLHTNKESFKKIVSKIKVLDSFKGVKFEQQQQQQNLLNSRLTNYSNLSINQPLKPILKLSNQKINGSDEYSADSNSSSSQSSSAGSVKAKPKDGLKLPPIANCSDVFYAVLKDLEKEQLTS